MAAATLLVLAGLGCQKYAPLTGAGDARIWVRTSDATEIYRCYDMVPQGPGQSVDSIKPAVVCKRAKLVDHD